MKKFLITVLTVVFTLSLATMAMAANTGSDLATTPSSVNYDQYPNGYGAGAGGLSTSLVANGAGADLVNDNGFNNANNTGVGVGGQTVIGKDAVKNVKGQRTHGEYANNTNSCASCHQVHTAAASNLLFKDGVYQTCTACHDGTLGVLNVFAGSTAGTFGGTSDGHASMHLADGVMQTKAAPGGNHVTKFDTKGNDISIGGTWAEEFNCASCHSPHGSYSDRLLNYNPNNIGETDMYFRAADGSLTDKDGKPSATPVKTGGMKVVGAQVQAALPTPKATAPQFVLLKTTAGDAGIPATLEAATEPIVTLYKLTQDSTTKLWSYQRDLTPWIANVYNTRGGKPLAEATNFFSGYAWGTDNLTYALKFSANPTLNTDDKIIVKAGYGYVKNGPNNGLDSLQYADICRATVVKFAFLSTEKATFNDLPVKEVDINSYAATDAASYGTGGFGVAISGFCASCHTDYFVSAGSDSKDALGNDLGKGVWSKAFRHNTTSDSYTCLKCHFAHGTDVSVMLDAKDQSVATLTAAGGQFAGDPLGAKAYMLDNNASSALKRYTNMSVCWKCHTSSHSEDLTQNRWVSGVNANGFNSTEFNKTGSNLPQGWVSPTQGQTDQTSLPYGGNNN